VLENITGERDAAGVTISITVFKDKRDTQAKPSEHSWAQIADRLCRHQEREGKDGWLWSPTIYHSGAQQRAKANVQAVTCLVLDMDNGTLVDALRPRLEPYAWAGHSTWQHTSEAPHYRIVLPLTHPVPAEAWGEVWKAADHYFSGGNMDPSCKDVSRIYYGPSCPRGAERWAEDHPGAFLDPDDLPVPLAASTVPSERTAPRLSLNVTGDYRTLDVTMWFQAHGHYGRTMEGGKHAVLCPWHEEHSVDRPATDSDTVVWEASGDRWPNFHCAHAHFDGRDFRDLLTVWPDADTFCAQPFVSPEGEPGAGSDDRADTGTKSSAKETVVELALRIAGEAELFQTPEGETYATVQVEGHRETHLVSAKGSGFRKWLRARFFEMTRKAINATALGDVMATLEAMAVAEGRVHEVYTRLAAVGGRLHLDLGDPAWRVVEIGPEGWGIRTDAPVRFRRPKGLLALPEPLPGGDLAELRPFVNIASDEDWQIFVAWLLAAIRGRGPYPILQMYGERGCAKSTATHVARRLIDPGFAPARDAPKEARDLAIAAKNNAVLAYDNLSHLPAWLSDAFCRLSTGSGFATRTLHTDDEESLFQAARAIVLNGIEELGTRGDLLDRSLIIHLPVIPKEKRREESELWEAWTTAHPRLLGALLTVVSSALKELPHVHLTSMPRMADFTRWITAAEPGLGWAPGSFEAAYAANRENAVGLEIEASPVGQAVLKFMENRGEWEGSAKELLSSLSSVAGDLGELKGWPRTPRGLTGALQRVAPGLRAQGVAVAWGDREPTRERKRIIRLRTLDN
jgi:hypothetical protein